MKPTLKPIPPPIHDCAVGALITFDCAYGALITFDCAYGAFISNKFRRYKFITR